MTWNIQQYSKELQKFQGLLDLQSYPLTLDVMAPMLLDSFVEERSIFFCSLYQKNPRALYNVSIISKTDIHGNCSVHTLSLLPLSADTSYKYLRVTAHVAGVMVAGDFIRMLYSIENYSKNSTDIFCRYIQHKTKLNTVETFSRDDLKVKCSKKKRSLSNLHSLIVKQSYTTQIFISPR